MTKAAVRIRRNLDRFPGPAPRASYPDTTRQSSRENHANTELFSIAPRGSGVHLSAAVLESIQSPLRGWTRPSSRHRATHQRPREGRGRPLPGRSLGTVWRGEVVRVEAPPKFTRFCAGENSISLPLEAVDDDR